MSEYMHAEKIQVKTQFHWLTNIYKELQHCLTMMIKLVLGKIFDNMIILVVSYVDLFYIIVA